MGLVQQAAVFTMDDLMRLPPVSRIHFIECGANTGMEWGNVSVPTVQYTHGMLSCCEFTGVQALDAARRCAASTGRTASTCSPKAPTAPRMTRTIPMDRALDDVLVAWAMNGEMLRPENGYPLRLVAPGDPGRVVGQVAAPPQGRRRALRHQGRGVAALRRPDARRRCYRQYTSIQECKSVITSPSGGQVAPRQGLLQRHRPRLVGTRQA